MTNSHLHGRARPRSITEGLRLRGVDVLTVQEDGRAGRPDPEALDRARELDRLLFTQDVDFLEEARRRQAESRPFAGVVFARQRGASIGTFIDDLLLIATYGCAEDFADRVEFLPFH